MNMRDTIPQCVYSGLSRTYANFPLSSGFPLIAAVHLDKSFADFFAAKPTYRRSIRPPGGRARWAWSQLVGHLTVNEDCEGSHLPPAPAKFSTNPNRIFQGARLKRMPLIAIETRQTLLVGHSTT